MTEQEFLEKEKKELAAADASSWARELSFETATYSTWLVKVAAASSVAASVDLVVVVAVAAAFALEEAAVAAWEQDLVAAAAASFRLAAI